jgi:endonuclease YncB( thermonuclease family)
MLTYAVFAVIATVTGQASVIDADTIEIHGERIRLVGVDAPESGQKCLDARGAQYRCGTVAANALDAWINRNPVTCNAEGRDRYQRLLAACTVRGVSVQEWLVTNGYAIAYRSYSMAYVPAEQRARTAKAGVWAGRFVEPWNWRRGQRLAGERPTQAMLRGEIAAAD